MKSNLLKKTLAFLLTAMMVLSVVPVYGFASENTGDDQTALIAEDSSRALSDSKLGVSKKNTSGKFSVSESGTSITAKAEYNGLRAKGTLVITNNHSTAVVLSFGYSLSGSGASASGLNGSSGFYQKKLNKNESLEIAITTGGLFDNATLYLTNVTAKEIVAGAANINFVYDSAYGSVSGSGTAGQTVTITAAAASGSKFLAWTDEKGLVISKNSSFSFLASGNDTIKALFTNPNGEAYFEAGNYISADINKAAAGGSTIVLVADGILGAGNYTVPAGSTLLIPKDTANTINTTIPDRIDKSKYVYVQPTAFRTLKMADGAKITVNGALNVAGTQYAGGSGDIMGGVYGPVGFIRMDTGSKITVNGGANLYAWGYIIGSGEVEILKNGTVYESFQSTDWRGGSATSALATDDNNHVFPMTQYYIQNIEVPMKLYAGAFEKGYSCTTVTLAGIQGAEVPFIGSGDSNLFTIDSGYIIKDYDENTDRQVYKAYGSLSMKKIKVSMKVTALSTVTLDSSKYVLPITNNLSVEVFSGTMNITQDICFLPGSEIIIHKGATGNLANGKSVYVYDLDQWGGFVGPNNATFIPLPFAPGRPANVKRTLTDAKIQIDGTVNASAGFLYTTTGGAIVTSTGSGRVVMKTGTATETYQISQINTDTSNVAIPVVLAKLQNADGTTTNPTKEINPTIGTIYTYTNGIWVAKCRNNACVPVDGTTPTCANGVPCKYCGHTIIGHVWDEGYITVLPDCENDGERVLTCMNCYDFTTIPEPALGHDIVSYEGKKATCTQPGWHDYDACTRCEYNTMVTVPALGHDIVKHDAKAETCTSDGWNEYETCKNCSYNTMTTIPMLGHDWDEGYITVLPECGKDGEREVTCKRCYYSKTIPEPALNGHDIVNYEGQKATCTQAGWYAYEACTHCDYSTKVEIPAIGHNVEIFEIKKPTCTENGLESEICTICGSSFSAQIIPATGHSYKTVVIQPTCTEKGFTTNICECGDYHIYDYTEKTAHIDADGDYYCDYCEEQINSDTPESNCSHICHQEGFFGFIWQIVQFFWKLFGMNPVCDCGAAHY